MDGLYFICTNCDILIEKSSCIVKAFLEILPQLAKPKLGKRYECPFCNKPVKICKKILSYTIHAYADNQCVDNKI